MRTILATLTMVPLLCLAASNHIPDPKTLTGDEADACAAILCLSSATGRSVAECRSPLRRYFSINAEKFKDTIIERRNFLQLCPTGDFESKASFLDALAKGAGRCEAMTLNETLKESKLFEVCRGQFCTSLHKYRIVNQLPSYCQPFIKHIYTDFLIRFQGTSKWQTAKEFANHPAGQWVEQNKN